MADLDFSFSKPEFVKFGTTKIFLIFFICGFYSSAVINYFKWVAKGSKLYFFKLSYTVQRKYYDINTRLHVPFGMHFIVCRIYTFIVT